MRLLRSLSLITLLLQTSGCAYLSTLQGTELERVERWVAAREYGKALDSLADIQKEHPNYRQLRAKRAVVAKAAVKYERDTVRRATALTEQERWGQAIELYNVALRNYPQGPLLQKGLKQLRDRQHARLSELELEMLIERGRWLEKAVPLYRQVAEVDAENDDAQAEMQTVQTDATQVALALAEKGSQALQRKELGLAGRVLPLAGRLTPLGNGGKGKDGVSAGHPKQEGRRLIAAFNKAFADNRLSEAQLLMRRLEQVLPRDKQVRQLRDELQQAVNKTVQENHEKGISLYGRGKYEEAIAAWSKVLELEPKNEQARAHLERAQKVVDRLRLLRDKQG